MCLRHIIISLNDNLTGYYLFVKIRKGVLLYKKFAVAGVKTPTAQDATL